MSTRHLLTTAGLAAAGIVLLAGPASAHISPTVDSAAAGGYLTFSLQVPHGCSGDGNTNKIEVSIPEGITSVTPGVVAGWTISETQVPLATPLDDGEGGQITERTSVITWSGGPLAHDQLQLFPLSVKLPDSGDSVSFPVVQSCDNGQATEWNQPTVEGQDEPEHPAPTITLTAATGDEHGHDDESAATTVAAEKDDDDDGSSALGIAGIALGVVGIGLGGTALRKARTA